ncbi:hypothetical protein Naga_101806g2 [Nannochloropsis gaditana]|uniref:Uncharacterized protein n=1 Tax=Nannochloropsis gaditana TaxID=72520 RepID=W7TFC6_9STRA|nr:hypothetical protein Naga_101806g2 [Nannochloropsis gaditana]
MLATIRTSYARHKYPRADKEEQDGRVQFQEDPARAVGRGFCGHCLDAHAAEDTHCRPSWLQDLTHSGVLHA